MAAILKTSEKPAGLKRFLPILGWLPSYHKSALKGDIIAGLTVLALLIPEGMAYAQIAGMPPQTAFYAAPIGLLLYAIFGTSRQLVVAVSAAIATMSFAAVSPLADAGSARFIALTAALAMTAGVFSILAGVFKLGRISAFFSESVLAGFVTGLALTIAIKQVPKILGIESGSGNFWERLLDIFRHLPETHLPTLIVGLGFLVLLLFMEHRFEKIPAALVALVLGIVLSVVLGLESRGVEVVGDVPAGLAAPKLPDISFNDLALLIPGALGIALVNFAEAYGPARSFSAKHRYDINANQELIGLGAANLGAGLFQGFSIGSSLSKSAANDHAGAKTPVALIICAALTVLVALFFTPLFRPLPEAVLGAVVITAILGMMKFKKMRRFLALNRTDFWLALVAMLGVLTFEPLVGLLIAVVLSLVLLVMRASRPNVKVLGREPGSLQMVDMATHPKAAAVAGMLAVRPDANLFFANADALREKVIELMHESQPAVKAVLIDMESTTDIDVPSAEMLHELHGALARDGVKLMLARVRTPVRALLDQSGATAAIGAENFYPRALGAVAAFLKEGDATALPFSTDMAASLTRELRDLMSASNVQEADRASIAAIQNSLDAVNTEIDAMKNRASTPMNGTP